MERFTFTKIHTKTYIGGASFRELCDSKLLFSLHPFYNIATS